MSVGLIRCCIPNFSFGLVFFVSLLCVSQLPVITFAMATTTSSTNSVDPSRFVYGSDDALFGSIEQRQMGRPWGRVLDAGTGVHSLRWLATLESLDSCTAVTADASMQTNCQREVEALGVTDRFDIIRGNWFPNAERPDETDLPALQQTTDTAKFDVILADYLIGAMDGFSPYAQDCMLDKLTRYLEPGGRLYIVGLQPLPDTVPNDPAATLICRIRQVRDACILLAGHRCYREYPLTWMERQISQHSALRLCHSSQFPILYSHATALKQINVGRSKLSIVRRTNPILADGLARELQTLDEQLRAACDKRPGGKIELGFDYVVTAELV